MAGKFDDEIKCSFCGKRQSQVKKLIAGPSGVYICDECVDICSDILEEELDGDDGCLLYTSPSPRDRG